MIWNLFKWLVVSFLALCILVPIAYKLIQVAQRLARLVHEMKLNRTIRNAALVDLRRKEITWHGIDERGFGGVLIDLYEGLVWNADTGERVKLSAGPSDPNQAQQEITGKARLFSSLSGVKIEKKDVQKIAGGGMAKVQIEAETFLSEPAEETKQETVDV